VAPTTPSRSPRCNATGENQPSQACQSKSARSRSVKSAVETVGPTRAKLTVEVPFEELKPSLDAAYKRIAQQITIPGFRKGKVPPAIIDRQIGRGAVLDEAITDALPQLYMDALREN